MDNELKAKKDSDKKRNTFIVIAVLAPALFICLIIVVAIIIALNSMISPLQKATGVLGLSVENIFKRESAEELFEKMKDFPSVKGNYKNNNAMDDIEYLFFEEIYKVSKYTPCWNKDNAIALVMATLFYDGEINEAMNPSNQSYTKIKYNYSGDGYNEVVLDDNSDLTSQYENIEFDGETGTKEIKKLYSKACQGYEKYQQYLVDRYIPTYYPDLLTIKDRKNRNYAIAKIGEEIVFTADNYIRLASSSNDDHGYIIDYKTYKIKVPNSSYLSNENSGTVPIIIGNNCTLKEETWEKLENPLGNAYCNISSCFGVYGGSWGCTIHSGGSIDLTSNDIYAPIYAIADGTVTGIYSKGNSSCYSSGIKGCSNCVGERRENYVTITSNINGDIVEHSYFHLSEVNVSYGEKVSKGTQIGKMGNTGCSSGNHLDFRFSDGKGNACNPEKLMKLTGCDIASVNSCASERSYCGM